MYFANYAAPVKISTKRCTRGRVVPFPECARVGRHALPEAPINGGRFAVERGVAGAVDVWAHARKWVEIFYVWTMCGQSVTFKAQVLKRCLSRSGEGIAALGADVNPTAGWTLLNGVPPET